MLFSNLNTKNYHKTISTIFIICLSTWATSLPKTSLIDRNGHIFQLSSISQSGYEKTAPQTLKKPVILEDEKGLCGLFALYQAHCLLQAFENPKQIDNPTQVNTHIVNLNCTKSFNQWVQKNEAIFQKSKLKLGRLGNVTNHPIKKWSKSILTDEQRKRFQAFDYQMIKDESQSTYNFYTKFSHNFQDSDQPHVVVFNLEKHWITVAFNGLTTWIIDSSNISRVQDKRVLVLDRFMRKKSASGIVQNTCNKIKSIISLKEKNA